MSRLTAAAMLLPILLAMGCSPAPPAEAESGNDLVGIAPLFPAMARLRVVLMSSLPLMHGDGVDMAAVIAGQSQPHPLYEDLAQAHELVMADMLDAATLGGADLVILVQPRALQPEELVALDDHVRGGGRLLLFADPMLDWSGGRMLADPSGPVRTSLMSPLLAHWGLELIDPQIDSARLGEAGAIMVHPGQFIPLQGNSGDGACRISSRGHVARCRPGDGSALLVADADLLDPSILAESGESGDANRRFVARIIGEAVGHDTS
jgi:ABC-type uncharacterized transport system involved in gliding motility auxiliary subunit